MRKWVGAIAVIFGLVSFSPFRCSANSPAISGTVRDANGPIANATVILTVGEIHIQLTLTDVSGAFQFDPVPRGSYQVRVEYPGFQQAVMRVDFYDQSYIPVQIVLVPHEFDQSALSQITPRQENQEVNIRSAEPQSIGDSTPSEQDADTLSRFHFALTGVAQSSTGEAIANARIALWSHGVELQSAVADETGRFSFDAVSPGDYELRCESPGWKSALVPVKIGYSQPGPLWVTLDRFITISGCLGQSRDGKVITIGANDGKTYVLISSHLPLQSYLGHTLTVSGAVSDLSDDENLYQYFLESGAWMLTVTKMRLVSESCH